MTLTEDQIERIVERRIDRLDARFVRGKLTQPEYDAAIHDVDQWAQREYPYSRSARRNIGTPG